MDKKQRERGSDFTYEETEKLVKLVCERKSILENKKSDAITWKEKEIAWQAIEKEFNCTGRGPFRSAKHLKLKYDSLKRDTRKKCGAIRAERFKTGGGTSAAPTLTPIELMLKEIILLSVEGGESVYDSDQLPLGDPLGDNTESENITVKNSNSEYLNIDWENIAVNNNAIIEDIDLNISEEVKETAETDNINAADNNNNSKNPVTKKWATWKPKDLRTKKHPALSKPQLKRPFDKLAETKTELAELQKKIIEEEMTEKSLKIELLKLEILHKKEMFQLEKEQIVEQSMRADELFKMETQLMTLKKALLEAELEKAKKNLRET